MELNELLATKRSAVVKRWHDLIRDTYPSDASNFLKKELDRFQNPVGYTITHDLGDFFDACIRGEKVEEVAPKLEFFVKIRSIQDFLPSQAVGFIFHLKQAVRENLKEEIAAGEITEALLRFESSVDTAALHCFESYMKSREKLHELRMNQIRTGPFKAHRRADSSCCSDRCSEKHEEDPKDGETRS